MERRSLTDAKQDLLQIDLNLSLDIGREKTSDTFSIILSLFSGDLIGGSGSFFDRFPTPACSVAVSFAYKCSARAH